MPEHPTPAWAPKSSQVPLGEPGPAALPCASTVSLWGWLVSQSPQRAGDPSPPPVAGPAQPPKALSPQPAGINPRRAQSIALPFLCCTPPVNGTTSPSSPRTALVFYPSRLAPVPNITQVGQSRAPQQPSISWHGLGLLPHPGRPDFGLPGLGNQGLDRDNSLQAFQLLGKLVWL